MTVVASNIGQSGVGVDQIGFRVDNRDARM